jgi:hypothetical protein
MKCLFSAIILLCFTWNVKAQTKVYTDTLISEKLYIECIKIGIKVFESAKAGKIKVYTSDSLKNGYLLKDLSYLNLDEDQINGLGVGFCNNNSIESETKIINFCSISILYNPYLNEDVKMPQQAMFYVKAEDFKKIASETELRYVKMLGSLFFASNNLYSYENSNVPKPDTSNIIGFQINDNINQRQIVSYLNKDNLLVLGNSITYEIFEAFNKATYGSENNLKNVFADKDLTIPYTEKMRESLNEFPEESTFIEVNKIIIANKVVGFSTDFYSDYNNEFYKNNSRFLKRESLSKLLPNWMTFIFDSFLLN